MKECHLLESLIFFLSSVAAMTEAQDIPATVQEVADEAWLGTFDIILLAAMLIGGIYWLLKRNQKVEQPVKPSFFIQ